MAVQRDTQDDLATAALRVVAQRSGVPPWDKRSIALHRDHAGGDWAVLVDWAARGDGTRVPASVTVTSLGGSLGDHVAEVEPLAVTRQVIESIPWGTVLWGSRRGVERHAALTEQPPEVVKSYAVRNSSREELLRHVAAVYRAVGGRENPQCAREVHARLQVEEVRPRGGGELSRETVRRWIQEARRRGYLPPVEERKEANESHPTQEG